MRDEKIETEFTTQTNIWTCVREHIGKSEGSRTMLGLLNGHHAYPSHVFQLRVAVRRLFEIGVVRGSGVWLLQLFRDRGDLVVFWVGVLSTPAICQAHMN